MSASAVGTRTSELKPLEPRPEDAALVAAPFGSLGKDDRRSIRRASVILVREFGEELRIWLLVFAVYALFDWRRKHARMPEGLLVLFAAAGFVAMLMKLRLSAGYVAGRYALPILPLLAMVAVTGMEAAVNRLASAPAWLWGGLWRDDAGRRLRRTVAIAACVVVGLVLSIPGLIRLQHEERHGHMVAARWLGEHALPNEPVYDGVGCSAFFARLPRWRPSRPLPDAQPTRLVVVDPSRIHSDSEEYAIAKRAVETGRLLARFPERPGSQQIGVYIYEMPPPASANATDARAR